MSPTAADWPLDQASINARIDALDPKAYAETRNHLRGSVSYLSTYITRGVITLPYVRDRLLARHSRHDCEKFLQELAWREYWQRVWWAKGDAIFSDLRFPRTDWAHQELVTAIVERCTGITAVDTAITELYTHGYMHNHARMWTAMLACNVAYAHWYDMSRWLYYHLRDGDLASNMLSWQWVAGTNAGKRYVAYQALINACSDTDQRNTYLDIPREAVGSEPIPSALTTTQPFTYAMQYPNSDQLPQSDTVLLYTPWTLDSGWRKNDAGTRVLLFDPAWFDPFPIAPLVRDFILALACEHIPDIRVFVGSANGVQAATNCLAIHAKNHPTLREAHISTDTTDWLHPNVSGYYPSFFKYWQAVTKP